MRQSTSNRAGEGVGTSTPSSSQGPEAWSALEPVTAWKEAAAATGRWWVMVGVGFGALGCLALGAAAVRALMGPSPESLCADGAGCNAAGVGYAEAADAGDDDRAMAARLFQRGCDFGYGAACNNLGLAYQDARGVPQDYELAMTAFARACSLDVAEGCSNKGTLYEHGHGVAANLGDARRLYSLACRRGSPLGCSNLGVLYAEGRGVEADDAAAARLFVEACRAGSEVGCTNLFASEQRAPQHGTPPAPEASDSAAR